jgi:hypothetical protein
MFLAPADLRALTGLQRPSAIARWLKARRYPHEIGADGWPRVLRSVVTRRLGDPPAPTHREPMLRLV